MKRKNKVFNKTSIVIGRNIVRWGATGMNWAPCPYKDALIKASKESLKRLSALEEIGRAVLASPHCDAISMSQASHLILRHSPAGRAQLQVLALQGLGQCELGD